MDGFLGYRAFANNSDLNTAEYQFNARADYEALNGGVVLDGSFRHVNSAFNDVLFRGTNVQDLMILNASASHRILADFEIVGRGGYRTNSNSNRTVARSDSRTYVYGGGVRYTSPAKNSLEFGYTRSTARNPTPQILQAGGIFLPYTADADDQQIYARVKWSPSVVWSLNSQIGYTWHNDRSVLDADFAGITQDTTLTYSPADRIALRLQAQRSFSSNDQVFGNGIELDSYSATLATRVGPRLEIGLTAQRSLRRFRYDLQAEDPQAASRRDKYWVLGSGAKYETGLRIVLSMQYLRIHQTSSLQSFRMTDNVAMLSATRAF